MVLGYTADGRLRVCAQPSYLAYVRAAANIHEIQGAWARVQRADHEYVDSVQSLCLSDDAQVVLRWALSRPSHSAEPGTALRLLAHGPSGLLLDLMSELIALVVDGSHGEEVRAAIASAGVKISTPPLLRSIKSLLAGSVLTVQQHIRLAEFLTNLGAARPLRVLVEHMLASDNSLIRSAGQRTQTSPEV